MFSSLLWYSTVALFRLIGFLLECQEAFYCFIRIIWGMTDSGAIPPDPDPTFLQAFHGRFSTAAQIKDVISSPVARELIPSSQVQTLSGLKGGRQRVCQGVVNVSAFFLKYTQHQLAKIGLPIWGPGLDQAIDSLLNEACRISALRIFRQVALGGAFDYMGCNKAYIEDYDLLEGVYNHYVHYVMASKYRKEKKQEGKVAKDEEKKVVLRARLRVSEF